jgi:hypothetical protein
MVDLLYLKLIFQAVIGLAGLIPLKQNTTEAIRA